MTGTLLPHRALLLVLTGCAFLLGTGEIMIAGLLPEIAAGLGVSLPLAGTLISVFALTVVVGGPLLALATGGVDRRPLVLGLLGVFAASNVIAALSSSYLLLVGSRALAAFAHAALMPLFFGVAVDLVPADKRATAVARVSLGLGLATVAGLPIGAAVGNRLGWRATFWGLSALVIVVVALLWVLLPPGQRAAESRLAELRVLRERAVLLTAATTALGAGAAFTAYTYIAPLLTEVTGFAPVTVTALLLVFGFGGTIGNVLGGKLADRDLMRTICGSLAVLGAALLLLGAVATNKPLTAAALFAFGTAYYAVIPAVNTRMLEVASQQARTLALTVQSSAFNSGIAAGGWFGGQLIGRGLPLQAVAVAGGGLAVVAALVAAFDAVGARRGIGALR
ncbi:MFS transporter, DHA1 family, inner membrane transport protein [Saccharopolyspora antimicrobica]|uniref:DHA1 family inner membrane transport protein n=1 Tax=Saccharopolyspora antimicrobica TaxID=455193 RepID=A0A1I5FZS2_9PSEU|nr:MFS transporter [Saccharopolyspora antimicrobica]RKT84005.1 DHA1 family inner membrane transport protein [Saccharopolyspora antimicrobica]SFO29099.1 MFS transporter, DHA1 family, inner membrane transport protein [Saccharopolyspora antimicrobica]